MRISTGLIFLIPISLQVIHIDLATMPLQQGLHNIGPIITGTRKIPASRTYIIGGKIKLYIFIKVHLRIQRGRITLHIRIRSRTLLTSIRDRSTSRRFFRSGSQADRMVRRITRLEEILNVIRLRNPRSSLPNPIHHRAIKLRQLQTDIQTRSPRLIRIIINTATISIYIRISHRRGEILIRTIETAGLPIKLRTIVTLSVLILQTRQIINTIHRNISIITYRNTFVFFSRLRSNQNNTVTGTHTIKGSRTSFQDRDRLNILRIDIIQSRSQDNCATRRVIVRHRHTVYNDKRLVISEGRVSTDHDILRSANLSTLSGDLYPGNLPGQRIGNIHLSRFRYILRFYFLQRIAQ